MSESEEQIRRRTRIEAHENYLIGRRIIWRRRRRTAITWLVLVALAIVLVLLAPHIFHLV